MPADLVTRACERVTGFVRYTVVLLELVAAGDDVANHEATEAGLWWKCNQAQETGLQSSGNGGRRGL